MDATLQADLQAVADKDQVQLEVTVSLPPVEPQTETLNFTPATPAA